LPVANPANDVASVPWTDLRLRAFPGVALRVMKLCDRQYVHMDLLARLIEADAAFSTEVLMAANGWTCARKEPVANIRDAVIALGIRRVQGLCLTVGVRSFLGKALHHPIARGVWRHSVACAVIAEDLARHSKIDSDLAYTAGILHDLGRLGLLVSRAREYTTLLDSHYGPPGSILEPEAAIFGTDHCKLGNHLIWAWELPQEFLAGSHHARRLNHWNLEELMKMSCRLADVAGFTAFPGCFIGGYSDLLQDLPEECRESLPPEIEALRTLVNKKLQSLEAD
jgi:putative nucleotidyltransferase with HDIG domain